MILQNVTLQEITNAYMKTITTVLQFFEMPSQETTDPLHTFKDNISENLNHFSNCLNGEVLLDAQQP